MKNSLIIQPSSIEDINNVSDVEIEFRETAFRLVLKVTNLVFIIL
jgi:hypothetical protein